MKRRRWRLFHVLASSTSNGHRNLPSVNGIEATFTGSPQCARSHTRNAIGSGRRRPTAFNSPASTASPEMRVISSRNASIRSKKNLTDK